MIEDLPYRINIDAPRFFREYEKRTLDLTRSGLARQLGVSRQAITQKAQIGKSLPREWLVILEQHYEGSKTEFWTLVKKCVI